MRRRHRIWYWVQPWTGFHDIWFDHRRKRWINRAEETPAGDMSSQQRCFTFRKALRVAHGIRTKFGTAQPDGTVIITRFFYKHGRRVCQEFALRSVSGQRVSWPD